ncbi:GNAT family N-acetyltransferase [Chryseobacterium panacisoli]|uniref:GNAT family N-acetyltransferase n=1 Tax=Chryseobacterium panacisoli TaxID=1807141 RepID=A0A5D8ZIB8_9FLAO|nr:GNAT family N-acetyltransferase [Chryseobacterium panacisoli]TZF93762.1 GNAT family N-acetyltransferase [Chryseobacterium panacisoli]
MINISYRKLQREESRIYRTIRLESLEKFPESFGATYQEAVNIEKFRIESDIEEQTPERFVFGAFAQHELVGICTFVKNENNTGSIYQMYVKREFQGKNIGQGLIEAVIAEASQKFNRIEIILEVTPGNDKAYNLYRKIGFQEIPHISPEEICMKYVPK